MKIIKIDEVIEIHRKLIKRFGGSSEIRDLGLLNLTISNIYQTYDGEELYPDDMDKIIQLTYSLIKNHCFVDGNKRIGVMMLVYLLEINNFKHDLSNEDLIKIGLTVASGDIDRDELRDFISRKIHKP